MPSYTPPLKDIDFLLHDVMKITESDIPGYDELDRDFTTAILDEAGKIARDVLFPLNEVGDRQGCKLENGVVRTPEGFGDAWKALSEGGWTGLDCDPEYGGQGLPHLMNTATGELFSSANMAFQIYTGLTHGAANALYAHGTDEQKRTYLPPMYEGRWTGTMNLTEPQCGTDLGLIRTKAEPQDDGSYSITGNKIWISGGEHDMAENIVHLVLAKIPGGPEGVKGISLFVVPKFLVKDDGSLGERNNLKCTALEEKMGIHGNATCYMSYEGAKGWLVGEEHKGLRAMFVMMNEARLSVGLEGYAQGEISYQNALAFARERVQGRDVTGTQNPDGPADPIIVHPDVRRNLLDQKSLTEGGRAFVYWAAELIDRSHRMDDQEAENLVSLLTPVVKGFLTDKGFESSVMAQQTLGGSGFTRDFGIEQYVRDARIAMIYEGTNGVQSLDLVGRKLGLNGGKPIMGFFEMVKGFIKENEGNEKLKSDFLEPLKAASKDLQAAGMYFMQEGAKNPLNALSGSYDFMHLFGHVCLGLMWGQMAKAAMEKMDEDGADTAFLTSKIETGRYYMARQLPATKMHLARIQSGADTVMTLDAAGF